jgi:hypothetical protein
VTCFLTSLTFFETGSHYVASAAQVRRLQATTMSNLFFFHLTKNENFSLFLLVFYHFFLMFSVM